MCSFMITLFTNLDFELLSNFLGTRMVDLVSQWTWVKDSYSTQQWWLRHGQIWHRTCVSFFAFEYQDAKHPTSNIQTWGMGIIHHKAWNHIFLLSIMSSKVLFPYKSIPYRNVFPVHSSRKFFWLIFHQARTPRFQISPAQQPSELASVCHTSLSNPLCV